MSNFRVGQQVACTKIGKWSDQIHGEIMPVCRGIYTIREMERDEESGDLMLRFEEIVNPKRHYLQGYLEARFWAVHFQPLQTTDISWAHKLVADLPKLDKRTKVSP